MDFQDRYVPADNIIICKKYYIMEVSVRNSYLSKKSLMQT